MPTDAPGGFEAAVFTGPLEREFFGQPECAARLRGLLSPAGHLRGARYASLQWRPAPKAAIGQRGSGRSDIDELAFERAPESHKKVDMTALDTIKAFERFEPKGA